VAYVPFNADFIGDPVLQPGDFVTLADTSVLGGGDVTSIITHSTWRYRGPHNLKGAGKHGLIRGVENQQIKAVNSIVAIARAAQDLALSADQSAQLIKDAIGGHVLIRQNPDETNEILIMDHPDPEQATKIWRWNMGGLGYSDNVTGADNPDRQYEIAMTMDGAINANFIKTGSLDAGVITVGPETTFAPGYDPTLIDPSASATMGVDSDCLGLWHFDGSLNSHKGVSAIGDESFDTGCFGQAVRVEEGTTNVIINGEDIQTQANNTGAGTATKMLNEAIPYWRVTASAGIVSTYENPIYSYMQNNCIEGQVYTISCEVRIPTAGDVSFFNNIGKNTGIPANAWTQIFHTFTFTSGYRIGGHTYAGSQLDYRHWQLEQKPYATPFVDGTRLGVLKAPITGLSPSQGTTSLRAKNLSASANGSVLVDVPQSDNSQGIRTGIASDGRLYAQDLPLLFRYSETTQADFQTGTLTDVTATSAGDLELRQDKFADNCSSITGWTVGGEGTPASDGSSFYASAYGTGTGLHGPSLAKSLGFTANDFTGIFDVRFVATNGLGNLRLSLLDSSDNEVAYVQLLDPWVDDLNTILTAYAGGTVIYNSGAGMTYSDYSGTFKLVRIGSTWTFYAGNTLMGTLNSGVTTQIAQVKLLFQQYKTCEVTTMKVNDINITTPYKSSGNREKVVDLSGANPAGGTKIEWSKTTPANTTVKVETALSTDGGSTYGAFTEATSGSSIPDITAQTDLSNARIKTKETLTTTDTSVTPKLHSLTFTIWEKQATKVYGPNKSTLTAWDSISLAWKSDRLSLVVNDSEACYIENPGLPTAFGSYLFVGTDRNGANAINTLVDELRIDKVYRDVAIRTGWHKTGVPFYTSEDMKQWPGNTKVVTEGLRVDDALGNLRVLVGSWLKGLIRKYGIKIIDGEIYSSLIRTGTENATRYIAFEPPNELAVYAQKSASEAVPYEVMRFLTPPYADAGASGVEWSYEDATFGKELYAWINAAPDSKTLTIYSKYGQLILAAADGVYCAGDFRMVGGTKYNVEQTENYGARGLVVRESPEQRYVDEGMDVLANGYCRIDVDPMFLECIEPHTPDSKWYVQLTPYGKAILYVDEIGSDYFIVKDYNDNANGIEFTWSLSATRKDYAMIRFMEVLD
jgi:hypothetical protein